MDLISFWKDYLNVKFILNGFLPMVSAINLKICRSSDYCRSISAPLRYSRQFSIAIEMSVFFSLRFVNKTLAYVKHDL